MVKVTQAVVLIALALAGCESSRAEHVQDWAQGQTIEDLRGCLGVPDKAFPPDAPQVVQWDFSKTSSGSMSLPIDLALLPVSLFSSGTTSMSISGNGTCRAIATLDKGKVVSLQFSGDSRGLSGPNAVCYSLVRDCPRK